MTALGPARADELRRQLADALTLEEREERMLAAWVRTGADAFATADIDLVVHASRSLEDALAQLGFERRGRFFVLPDAELFVEFPGTELPPGWSSTEVVAGNQRTPARSRGRRGSRGCARGVEPSRRRYERRRDVR